MTGDADVLDALGDECARYILQAGCGDGVTVDELTARRNVSESTIYRRLRNLESLDLIDSETDIRSGANRSIYTTRVERLEVAVGADGFDLSIDDGPNTGERLLELLEAVEFDHADVDFGTGTVDLRMQLDDELVDAFVEVWQRIGVDDEE